MTVRKINLDHNNREWEEYVASSKKTSKREVKEKAIVAQGEK